MENCFFTSKKYYDLYMQNNSKRLVEYPLILPTRGYDDINALDIFEYTPLQIKQAVTGYGRADKIQVQRMVKMILNHE